MKIIDGKKISENILEKIKYKHEEVSRKINRKAGLAVIIVGNDPASKVYVKNKIKACERVGFYSIVKIFDDRVTKEELLSEINYLNDDENIDGILVQLPLPKHIDEIEVINQISPEKDVDGFHMLNLGKIVIGDKSGFLPCTPYGIMELFKEYDIELEGKDIVVIGRSNIVGKPMALMLIEKGATVLVCNSKTKDLSGKLKKADIIIAAAGVPKLVKDCDVKEGAIIIDVGINRVNGKLCGDIDYEKVSGKASYITPVPGGVGPMTIASLLKNTLISYEKKYCKLIK